MNRRDALRLLAYTGVTAANLGALASFLSGCSKRKLKVSSLAADRYGVCILVDGLRADVFREMLDAGALPNIKTHLVDRGALVETCVSTFPSTTGPAHLPFITGVMPGCNDCPGLRWVDREHRKIRDYCTMENVLFNSDFPQSNYTLYEVLYGTRTVCVFDFASRGATDVIRVPTTSLWFMFTGDKDIWRKTDRHAADACVAAYTRGGTFPRFTFVWMPAIDHLAHFHGSRDGVVYDRAKDADEHVGRIVSTLQELRIYDKTLLSLVADHGLRDTIHHLDLKQVLEKYGLEVMGDLTDNDQFNSLYQNNAARCVSGNAFGLLYFATTRRGRLMTESYAWDRRIEYEELRHFNVGDGRIDLIELLRGERGLRLVMARVDEKTVNVFSGEGHGAIARDYASYKYTVTGVDPLGYVENPEVAWLMDGTYHDKDVWFLATRNTDYPDGIFQIAQIFDSERCGDIVVTAEPGWDLMDQGHIASHGGMDRPQLHVPCVIAGPDVAQGIVPIARTVDIYPTYLEYLGVPHDGEKVMNVFM
jgi:hypothetical protein